MSAAPLRLPRASRLAASRGACAVAACLLAGCGEKPRTETPVVTAGEPDAADDGSDLTPDRPDLPEVPEDERIAAIEHAMNQLAPVANQCWAAAAADDFQLAGDVRALISVGRGAGAGATVEITANSTDDDVLGQCLVGVLGAYAWAAPLAGQVVELPFHFSAPAMQNVIDRRFVPRKAQNGVAIGVLLDQVNSGNPALSLVEVEVPAAALLGPREVERVEVWTVIAGGLVVTPAGGTAETLAVDDVMIAPVGARLELRAAAGAPVRALVAYAPGGREGSARAGALPGRVTTMAVRARPVQPVVVRAAKAKVYPRATGRSVILVEAPAAAGKLSVSLLEVAAGAVIPPHVHAKETEALYVLAGGGTMTIAGVAVPVTEHSVVQVPAGVEHAFTAAGATRAIQLYSPAGPEQRFKKPK